MINKRGEEIEEQLDRTIISSLHLQLEHCIKLAIYVRIGVRWIKHGPSNDRRCTPEIRVRLVNTSLRYRLRGEEGWYGSRQLIRYVCKFVDTWAHSSWAVKYDSPINNDNLGRPIMPKLPWPRSSEGGTMIGPRAWPANEIQCWPRQSTDKTFSVPFRQVYRALHENFDGTGTEFRKPVSPLTWINREMKICEKWDRRGFFFDDRAVGWLVFLFF